MSLYDPKQLKEFWNGLNYYERQELLAIIANYKKVSWGDQEFKDGRLFKLKDVKIEEIIL